MAAMFYKEFMEKLQPPRPGLVPKKVLVRRAGKIFQSIRWVKLDSGIVILASSLIKHQNEFLKAFDVFSARVKNRLRIKNLFVQEMIHKTYLKSGRLGYYSDDKQGRDVIFIASSLFEQDLSNKYETDRGTAIQMYLIHEMSHHIDNVGLTKAMRKTITNLFDRAKRKKTAISKYALTNEMEYFAENVAYYFKLPHRLQEYDLDMYKFLKRIL